LSKLPNYLASVDAAGDLFSLAAVLYQLVAEVPAFPIGSTAEPERLRKIDPEIPPELERLVMSALDRDPQKRPRSAKIMRRSLCAIRKQLPQEVAAPAPLAASATAGAGITTVHTQQLPKPEGVISKLEVSASAAPQPAREPVVKSERIT